MLGKPFRPLTVSKPFQSTEHRAPPASDEPPLKKRRISPEVEEQRPENDPPRLSSTDDLSSQASSQLAKPQAGFSITRKPLHSLVKPLAASQPQEQSEKKDVGSEAYYNVVW